jgi:hypothetical protein
MVIKNDRTLIKENGCENSSEKRMEPILDGKMLAAIDELKDE